MPALPGATRTRTSRRRPEHHRIPGQRMSDALISSLRKIAAKSVLRCQWQMFLGLFSSSSSSLFLSLSLSLVLNPSALRLFGFIFALCFVLVVVVVFFFFCLFVPLSSIFPSLFFLSLLFFFSPLYLSTDGPLG